MEQNQELTAREQFMLDAWALGERLASEADFYDVVEGICYGWAAAHVAAGSDPTPSTHTGPVKSTRGGDVAVEAVPTPDQEEPAATTDWRLRLQMGALNEMQSVATSTIADRVGEARARYWTWGMIGEALEISRQAAHQRFSSEA